MAPPPLAGRDPMLQPVAVANKQLSDYTSLVGRPLADEIRERAEALKGKRILHVSATSFGGGVSEILYTLVPLMIDVGLHCEWNVIYGREEFFNATKLLHNALQGNPHNLNEEHWETWLRYNEINARELGNGWDVCIIHDPQPAAIPSLATDKARNWVWRCHVDLSTPNAKTLAELRPYLEHCQALVFHLPEYVPAGMDGRSHVFPPAIDRAIRSRNSFEASSSLLTHVCSASVSCSPPALVTTVPRS